MIAWTLFRISYALHRASEWCDVRGEEFALRKDTRGQWGATR